MVCISLRTVRQRKIDGSSYPYQWSVGQNTGHCGIDSLSASAREHGIDLPWNRVAHRRQKRSRAHRTNSNETVSPVLSAAPGYLSTSTGYRCDVHKGVQYWTCLPASAPGSPGKHAWFACVSSAHTKRVAQTRRETLACAPKDPESILSFDLAQRVTMTRLRFTLRVKLAGCPVNQVAQWPVEPESNPSGCGRSTRQSLTTRHAGEKKTEGELAQSCGAH